MARGACEKAPGYYNDNEYVAPLAKLYYALGRTEDALETLDEANGFSGRAEVYYIRVQMAAVTQSPDAEEELNRASC